MNKLKIKSIKSSTTRHVYDLTVEDNHNFFITNKNILTHNCDYLSHSAQAILRGLMETYSSQARFILTCNFPQKIMPALHSRCHGIHIAKPDVNEFTARAATVLVCEEIDFDLDVLDMYVKATYPDLRKCLNQLQSNSFDGTLLDPAKDDVTVKDWRLEVVSLFADGQIRQARQVICNQAIVEDIDSIFRWMYDNLSLWGDTDEEQDEAILAIRKGLVWHSQCADAELNISATLTELISIRKNK